jgi:hypothetical protein
MLGGSIAAALAGAAAGMVLYVALIVLAWAARAALVLLGIGVVLHLLELINLWHVMNTLFGAASRMM